MLRIYHGWAVLAADTAHAGLMAAHADDGSGDKVPLLFRNKALAEEWIRDNSSEDIHAESARVKIAVETQNTGFDLRPSYAATAKHLREMLKTERHTQAVADCRHCSLNYAAAVLEELVGGPLAKPKTGEPRA
jgi:hypothetical protein